MLDDYYLYIVIGLIMGFFVVYDFNNEYMVDMIGW